MTEPIGENYAPRSHNVRISGYESPDAQKATVTVKLPSEYWALISGLSKDAGRDDAGRNRVLWAIEGVQSLDLSASVIDECMTFNIDAHYDISLFHKNITVWLEDLRLRRAEHEVALKTTPEWHKAAMRKIGSRSIVAAADIL